MPALTESRLAASGSQEEEDRERGGDRDADRETAWRVE